MAFHRPHTLLAGLFTIPALAKILFHAQKETEITAFVDAAQIKYPRKIPCKTGSYLISVREHFPAGIAVAKCA
jgi:hypothetical protein